jgi:hypothetical protein
MNALVIALFVALFAAEFLVKKLGVVHQYFMLVPELLSGIAVLALLKYLLAGRRWAIDWRYALFLAVWLFVIVFGFLAQSMPSGAIVSGMRNYLKFLPFFLLPAVYPFTMRQLGAQLAVLLALLAAQSPVAVYQRFVQYAHQMHTGDPVAGFTTSSSVLSILMMWAIAATVSMYLRRMLRFGTLLTLVAIFMLPTTLNETKATLILLPVALLLPAWFMPRGSGAWRRVLPIAVVGLLAGTAFISAYDYLIQSRDDGTSIENFITEGRARTYLYSGAADGEKRYIGRFDSIVIAARQLAQDPLAITFGLGAGNVSASPLRGFDGAYVAYYDRFGVGETQVTTFLWEIGVAGLAAFAFFCALIFRDARALGREPGGLGLLGQVWATITVMVVLSLLYVSVFAINEIAYFFWFYSGVVASALVRQRRAARSAARAAPPAWYATDGGANAAAVR